MVKRREIEREGEGEKERDSESMVERVSEGKEVSVSDRGRVKNRN